VVRHTFPTKGTQREFIKSESVLGSQEKLYSLTEPGKRKAVSIIDATKGKKDD